jgi:hypothetical protein
MRKREGVFSGKRTQVAGEREEVAGEGVQRRQEKQGRCHERMKG